LLKELKPDVQYTAWVRVDPELGISNTSIPLTFSTKETSTSSFYPDLDEESVLNDDKHNAYDKQKLGK
jgi:hypothetical protein